MPDTLLTTRPGGFRAGGIVIHDDKLLLMHVIRTGDKPEEFYILPGGHWEKGEMLEETCIREIKEEFGIDVVVENLEYVVVDGSRVAFYFLCTYQGGDIVLGGPEKELHDSDEPEEIYVEWVALSDVPNIPIGPQKTKQALIEYLHDKGYV